MAFQTLDTSWSGTYAPYLIAPAIYGMDTLKKGVVAVETGIKKIHTIDRMDIQNPLSVRQAVPTAAPNTGFTIDARTLTPGDFQTYQTINPRDLEQTQFSELLADAILEEVTPASLQGQLMQLLLGRCAEQIENGLWMGSTAYQGHYAIGDANYQLQFFNGFMQRMVNDPLVNLSSVSPLTITSSNIVAILDDLIYQATTKKKALITDDLSYERMKFCVSAGTWQIYTQALRTNAYKGLALDEGGTPMWGGWKVERLAGMPDNTIVFCRATSDPLVSNLWVGMNSEKDWNLLFGHVDSNEFAEAWAMLAKWKFDVNYGWPAEIFLYTTLTKASFIP